MRGQQGAAGEVIELLAQKSGSHPMGIMALLGDGVFGGSCRCIISTKVSHEVPIWRYVKVFSFQDSVEMSNKFQSLWGVHGRRSYLYLYITNPYSQKLAFSGGWCPVVHIGSMFDINGSNIEPFPRPSSFLARGMWKNRILTRIRI